jgi:hypothetical protein
LAGVFAGFSPLHIEPTTAAMRRCILATFA